MTKIYTYHNLKDLPKQDFFEDLLTYPHITATYEMSKCLNESDEFKFRYGRSVCFSSLLKEAVPRWKKQTDRMERMAMARQYFREAISSEKDLDRKRRLMNYRKRASDFVSAITLLTESAITPGDVPCINENIRMLRNLWNYLIDNGDLAGRLNGILDSLLERTASGKTRMELCIESVFGPVSCRTIVLHGFYFITPIQRRIFDALMESGFDLIFLINYDWSCPYSNKIWTQTYSEYFGFPPMNEWRGDRHGGNNPLGRLLEGRKTDSDNIDIVEHSSIIDLVRDIAFGMLNDYRVYTPDHKTTDDLLKNFFSNEYGQMNLSAYPAGLFLSTLNSLWDDESESLRLSMDDVKACFSTGWLNHGQYDSTQCMFELEKLSSFFDGCSNFEEWRERLDLLVAIKSEITPYFHEGSTDRWERVMSNPFITLPSLSLPPGKMEAIASMIAEIMEIAEHLFSDRSISIAGFLGKMDEALEERVSSPDLEDQYIMMHEFLNRIKEIDFSREYDARDIRDSLDLFLVERPERADDYGVDYFVHPLSEVESARLSDHKVLLILCDIERMPGPKGGYLWPLNEDIVCMIRNKVDMYRKGLMDHLINVTVSTPLSNRYLFCDALCNENVTVSWVRGIDGKTLYPSPFITLMVQELGKEIRRSDRHHISHRRVEEIAPIDHSLGDFSIIDSRYVPNEAKRDYALCPLRFLYGYLLTDHPTFSSKFHMQFVIGNLISSFKELCPELDRGIQGNVLDLFPNISPVEKRQIMDYVHRVNDPGYDTYEGRRYTNLRNSVHFLTRDMLSIANEKLSDLYSNNGREGLDITEPTEFRDVCKYCPHVDYCRRSVFSIDQDDVYGKKS